MKTLWTQGLEKDAQKEMKDNFTSSHRVRKRMKELLLNLVEVERKKNRSEALYEVPNWQYKQADSLGYERALYEVMSLIEENEEK